MNKTEQEYSSANKTLAGMNQTKATELYRFVGFFNFLF